MFIYLAIYSTNFTGYMTMQFTMHVEYTIQCVLCKNIHKTRMQMYIKINNKCKLFTYFYLYMIYNIKQLYQYLLHIIYLHCIKYILNINLLY